MKAYEKCTKSNFYIWGFYVFCWNHCWFISHWWFILRFTPTSLPPNISCWNALLLMASAGQIPSYMFSMDCCLKHWRNLPLHLVVQSSPRRQVLSSSLTPSSPLVAAQVPHVPVKVELNADFMSILNKICTKYGRTTSNHTFAFVTCGWWCRRCSRRLLLPLGVSLPHRLHLGVLQFWNVHR